MLEHREQRGLPERLLFSGLTSDRGKTCSGVLRCSRRLGFLGMSTDREVTFAV